MSYLELEGDRWILAVAQKPFIAGTNEFCTLTPVVSDAGKRAKLDLFPNSGLVWWMVLNDRRLLAQPGRLLVAELESAPTYATNDETKHLYQADAFAITPAGARDAMEVLTVGDPAVASPARLIGAAPLKLDHHPTDSVWVRIGGSVYGPFKTRVEPRSEVQFDVTFEPPRDWVVRKIPEPTLSTLGGGYCRSATVQVSRNAHARYDATAQCVNIAYELLIGEALERIRGMGEPVELDTEERVIARAAKQLLPRKKRQELTAMLTELEELVRSSPEYADAATVVQAIQHRVSATSDAIDLLVERIVQTGVLDKRLEARLKIATDAELQRQASYLTAEAEQQTAAARQQLEALRAETAELDERNAQRRAQASATLEQEMEARRREIEADWRAREQRLAGREASLSDREATLRAALEGAARRLEERRADVVADVLTVLPLLSSLPGMVSAGGRETPARETEPAEPQRFDLPAFVRGERGEQYRTPMREDEFFSRFGQHVRDAGFAYADDDIFAFHMSVKCSDLTLLSGVSGTGKSSLPKFYMEALQGEEQVEADGAGGRYLHVAVRPSWLDQQDLLGHVNALDHDFVPAESGLFSILAAAAEEYRRRGPETGLYLVCLDEMNLAQVEHYFGSFLSALERPEGERRIRCFDPASVAADSPFRPWGQLPLPPSLHFVGTVNNDETTRPLSLRFLDRTNDVELATQDFHALRTASRSTRADATVPGRAVILRDLRSWVRDEPLSPELAAVLDRVREPLRRMRRPLTPRRYQALTRFVASAAGLGDPYTPDAAFDLHMKLRLVPQLRTLGTPEAGEGLSELIRTFEDEGYTTRFPRTAEALRTVEQSLRPMLALG